MTNLSICSEPECATRTEALGLCAKHYMRLRRAGIKPDTPSRKDHWLDRFLRGFDDSAGDSGCWPWAAGVGTSGYGTIYAEGKAWGAHRLSYALHYGDLPAGLLICHTCDNRPCVNPAHLYAGTVADNTRDMVVRERTSSPLTADKVRELRDLYAAGGISMSALSRKYGVALASVFQILHRKTWSHVA